MKYAVIARIYNSEGALLLLERYPNDRTNSGWCLPGGKIDVGEEVEQALFREVLEEIGCVINTEKYIGQYISEIPGRSTFTVHVFDVVLVNSVIELNTNELKSYGWFSERYLPTLAGNTLKAIKL